MTVKQLKEKLETMDESTQVFFYSHDDEGGRKVSSAEVTDEFPYCQGDEPDNLPDTFVLLT